LFPFEVTSFPAKPKRPSGRGTPEAKRRFLGEPPGKERSRICRKALDYIRVNTCPQDKMPPTDPTTPPDGRARVVLDTNVVLDWLLFADAACRPMASAIQGGALRWIATRPMRDELEHVLTSSPTPRWRECAPEILGAWDHWVLVHPEPPPAGPAVRLRCTDPDDQKFIDLAIGAGARWLVTRDRALLKLAPRSRPLGVGVMRPDAWGRISTGKLAD
jgi:predicted nucleic acid-binding protein